MQAKSIRSQSQIQTHDKPDKKRGINEIRILSNVIVKLIRPTRPRCTTRAGRLMTMHFRSGRAAALPVKYCMPWTCFFFCLFFHWKQPGQEAIWSVCHWCAIAGITRLIPYIMMDENLHSDTLKHQGGFDPGAFCLTVPCNNHLPWSRRCTPMCARLELFVFMCAVSNGAWYF